VSGAVDGLIDISISKRQVVCLRITDHRDFLTENRALLRAGFADGGMDYYGRCRRPPLG
jgi:hypothetical protein